MIQRQLFALCSRKGEPDATSLCRVILSDENKAPEWVELIPAGPDIEALDGRIFQNTSPEIIVANFKKEQSISGYDLPIDWEHSTQRKGPNGELAPASGWIKDLEVRQGAVWAHVDWTPRGSESLTNKEYRYISPAFAHTKAGVIKAILSAGLTNDPAFILQAVARSDGNISMAAQWTAADINNLPDSSFLFIEKGGTKDDEGKTSPRSLRHFPCRDAEGALDIPHLRNAISRIPQAKISGLTAADLTRLQEKAQKLLAKENASATASAQISEESMDKLLAKLGLSADATVEQVTSAVIALMAASEKAAADTKAAQDELATARATPPGLDKFVPRADYEAAVASRESVKKELAEFKMTERKKEIDAEIDVALKAGKIIPASKDFYVATCSSEGGLERFRDFVKTQPAIGEPSNLDDKRPPEADPAVTSQELAIAARCGITKEQYLAEMKREREQSHQVAN